jgi:hypothetical protein
MGIEGKQRPSYKTLIPRCIPPFCGYYSSGSSRSTGGEANDAHIPVHYTDVRKKELESFPASLHPFHRDEEDKKDEACSSSANSALYNLKQGL